MGWSGHPLWSLRHKDVVDKVRLVCIVGVAILIQKQREIYVFDPGEI